MKRAIASFLLLVFLVAYDLPSAAVSLLLSPAAVPVVVLAQDGGPSGSFGDPNDMFLRYSISGADFSQDPDGPPTFVGQYTGGAIHLSGEMTVARGTGYRSYVTMHAYLGDKSVSWPPEGEDSAVEGRVVTLPFDLTFEVPPGYESLTVTGGARVEACGGVCGSYAVDIIVNLEAPEATSAPPASAVATQPATPVATQPDAPKSPCDDPMFYYPGIDLNGYFTGQPALRYSGGQMRDDLVAGLQRFLAENKGVRPGVGSTDAYFIAKSFVSSAMPTGKEAALQHAARLMARENQKTDPNYRLTPGDLFYLSLKENNGNVRDALVTCHAALYRDGAGTNKQFVEQENILAPLRNRDGYADTEWNYTTLQGAPRTINPHAELGGDEQGVWYHFFGLTSLEFVDSYGAGGFNAAWAALEWGGLPDNYTDLILDPNFPKQNLDQQLGKLAIALEHNVRTNMGKPPDIAKYCVNYYALEAGKALKQVVQSAPSTNIAQQSIRNLTNPTHAYNAYGEILQKSPLSIFVEGTNGEWFSFDQRSGLVDGNTPLIYFELYPEEDGTQAFHGVPFFEVASIQLAGTGDGPATLGLYDRASEQSRVFEFDVHDGDQIQVTGLAGVPFLNGSPLAGSEQPAGVVPAATVSAQGGNISLLVIFGGTLGLLSLGAAIVMIGRSRRSSARVAPAPVYPAAGSVLQCPYCRTVVSSSTRFCTECGQPLPQASPLPSYGAGASAQPYPYAAPSTNAGKVVSSVAHCGNCGAALRPGVHFCEECGTKAGGPSPRNVQVDPPAYTPAPAPPSPVWTAAAEPVVGVLPVLERRKGMLSTEAFTLVLTSQRLVFARLTTEMQRAVVEQSKQAAKAEGKGFLGQWGAVLGVTSALRERYYRLPVDAILSEHPDNFFIPIQQVRQVKIKSGDVEELQPDQVVIQAAEKMKFDLKGPSARDAKQVLRQALGDRVR